MVPVQYDLALIRQYQVRNTSLCTGTPKIHLANRQNAEYHKPVNISLGRYFIFGTQKGRLNLQLDR